MVAIFLVTLVLLIPNLFLFRWLIEKYELATFKKIFLLGIVFYIVNASLIGAFFTFVDSPRLNFETLMIWGFITMYGMVLFSVFYIPLIIFLAYHWKEVKQF